MYDRTKGFLTMADWEQLLSPAAIRRLEARWWEIQEEAELAYEMTQDPEQFEDAIVWMEDLWGEESEIEDRIAALEKQKDCQHVRVLVVVMVPEIVAKDVPEPLTVI